MKNLLLFLFFCSFECLASITKNKYLKISTSILNYNIQTSIYINEKGYFFINNNTLIPYLIVDQDNFVVPLGMWKLNIDDKLSKEILEIINDQSLKNKQSNVIYFHQSLKVENQNGFIYDENLKKIKRIFAIIISTIKEKSDGELIPIQNGKIPSKYFSKLTNLCGKTTYDCYLRRYGLLVNFKN
jgi:hypothetical protein